MDDCGHSIFWFSEHFPASPPRHKSVYTHVYVYSGSFHSEWLFQVMIPQQECLNSVGDIFHTHFSLREALKFNNRTKFLHPPTPQTSNIDVQSLYFLYFPAFTPLLSVHAGSLWGSHQIRGKK